MKIARVLNVLAVVALVVSAVLVYRIKYDATLHAEQVAKLKRAISQEVDSVATLKAEWAILARPDRIQALAAKHLDLKPMTREQSIQLASLPSRPAPVDEIGKKLEALGLMGEDASIAVDKEPSAPAVKKPAAPARKTTIAVKPASQLKAPAARPASAPKPFGASPTIAPPPRSSGPVSLTDFLKKMGLVR
ncbi:hypothetical protein IHQ68_13640 [Chelatococcus sambhunathii]|uniref:Cell division protein FtsL n=1 Tax=Chelatococcus sambhunathii TaxID=363953 RepID=A0ABU1DHQ8_9HYPH|nr:hypothetical protein [Chelatococcus sambhunathii]MDR4307662.1 hypothetical protein [Chelatococcus sambhunathii]